MQEEVTQKTIALVIKTAKLDANVLKALGMQYHRIRTKNGAGKRIRTGGRAFE